MKKNRTTIVSANLSDLAIIIYKKLSKVRQKGWFSEFVSTKLVESYYKDFEKKILVEILNEKTKERNKLEDDIRRIAKKLKKIR